jgi:hypothetical protein
MVVNGRVVTGTVVLGGTVVAKKKGGSLSISGQCMVCSCRAYKMEQYILCIHGI